MQDPLTPSEQITSVVYGDTFALYDEAEFDAFVNPLRERFHRNGIDPSIFSGKNCLDAGCGGGRGSIFMLENGASSVVGLDISEANVHSSAARARQKRYLNVEFRKASLHRIPYPDATFDVVWCNGVLHHADDPDRGLAEITRVLKRGGHLWLYLYGAGGVYWHVVDWVRDLVSPLHVKSSIMRLRIMKYPVRRIAEWVDDWFAPFVRRYTADDVNRRLEALGFSGARPLDHGVDYDTSERRGRIDADATDLMGEGDLRYWQIKDGPAHHDGFRLPEREDGRGSPYRDSDAVLALRPPLERLSAALRRIEGAGPDPWARLAVAASVHSRVRSMLESHAPLERGDLLTHIDSLCTIVTELAHVEA